MRTNRLAPRLALLLLGLALASAQAATRWDPVMLSDQGMFYVDTASVRSEGERKEAWTLLDYRKPQYTEDGKPYLSTRAQVWINCRLQMGRIMHLTYFSGALLAGRELEKTGMLQEWQEIQPGTPMQKLAHKLC